MDEKRKRSKHYMVLKVWEYIFKRARLRDCDHGGVAQMGERLPCTQEAIGSNPIISTTWAHSSAG